MNKLIADLDHRTRRAFAGTVCFLLLVAVYLMTGCANQNGNTGTGPSNQVITSCKAAAYVGTAEYLLAHPEKRPAFVKAVAELKTFEAAEKVDFITLLAIVQRLDIKELKSPQAAIAVTTATLVLQDYAGALPLDRLSDLKPVAAAIRQGIELALGPQ